MGVEPLSSAASARAVFLDRDGVLNEAVVRNGNPYPPDSLETLVVPTDAKPALQRLHERGFRLVMVTNQPDIARKKVQRETVYRINDHLRSLLALDAVEVCEHDDADGCDCRKPAPGMLVRAAQRDGIALSRSFMVGDRWRDIEAGRRAGCRTLLIGDGYAEGLKSPPDVAVASLSEAADWILAQPDARAG
jgi:D-glycero-D-manno-heptose 1,7-bisphosphate phosphatase